MVVARDYLSQYPEAIGLKYNDLQSVARFIHYYIFCRWGVATKMSCDGGPENRGLVKDLQRQFGVNRVVSSAFHLPGQGLIERGHKVLVAALKKMTGNWVDNLPLALWADRVTVKRATGETLTWQTLPWHKVTDTASLIAIRARQFQTRDPRLQEAIDRTVRLRFDNKEYFEQARSLREERLKVGDMVLLRDSYKDLDISRLSKFKPKWKGPYRVTFVGEKGWYKLSDLDGTPINRSVHGELLSDNRTSIELPAHKL